MQIVSRQFAWTVKSYFLEKKNQIVSGGDNLYELSNPVFWEK